MTMSLFTLSNANSKEFITSRFLSFCWPIRAPRTGNGRKKKKKRKYYNFQLKRIWDNQFRLQQQIHTKTCPGKQRLFYDKIFLYSFKDFLHFIKTSKLITNNKWLFLSCINVILFFLTTLPPAVYMYIHIFFLNHYISFGCFMNS